MRQYTVYNYHQAVKG